MCSCIGTLKEMRHRYIDISLVKIRSRWHWWKTSTTSAQAVTMLSAVSLLLLIALYQSVKFLRERKKETEGCPSLFSLIYLSRR